MTRFFCRSVLSFALTCAILALPAAASGRTATKYKLNLPPSADLAYSIRARQSGLTLDGSTLLQWRASGNRFSIATETRAALVGKILEARSEGVIGEYGLSPTVFTEKRLRKPQTATTFDRESNTISFTKSDRTYPILGGEQDQSSAVWQLAAIARGAPAKFKPGSAWTLFVAGQKDAEPWELKVVRQEQVKTPLGNMNAFHVTRLPAPDSKGQQLDIWLAPTLEWYPVRLRFTEDDHEFIEQTLQKISKK